MSTDLLIQNATVVLPDRAEPGSVLVRGGKIAAIGKNLSAEAPVLDGTGKLLFPGFVDIHVHGGGGADFMDAEPAAFDRAFRAHLRHGTTAMMPTSMTATEEDLSDFVRAYLAFLPQNKTGVKPLGLHLEGPYFSGAGGKSKGAQPGNLLRLPDRAETDRLLALAQGQIKRIDMAAELPGACELAEYLHSRGVLCAQGHSAANGAEAMEGFRRGFSHVTHCYNACTTYHKEDQTVYAGVVEAAYLNDFVSIELICDGCHIPKEIVQLALKIKGARKVCAITDGMRIAASDLLEGNLGSLKAGSRVIVEDGVAKLPDRSSFAGSIATMDRCLRVLCGQYGVSLSNASVMLSLAPAEVVGAAHRIGSIAVGKDADFVLTDRQYRVTDVLINGVAQRL